MDLHSRGHAPEQRFVITISLEQRFRLLLLEMLVVEHPRRRLVLGKNPLRSAV